MSVLYRKEWEIALLGQRVRLLRLARWLAEMKGVRLRENGRTIVSDDAGNDRRIIPRCFRSAAENGVWRTSFAFVLQRRMPSARIDDSSDIRQLNLRLYLRHLLPRAKHGEPLRMGCHMHQQMAPRCRRARMFPERTEGCSFSQPRLFQIYSL